ncbi:restriction endonuclease subunit S [Syntrophomonas wolfei]|jgi:type I restriction enzyme S subunit|uniref:restriction endonuclease subunit S n=1 Tax=Syntrophomonas wolfei TaxID=863 RepID=UPI0023F0FD65|nr:restriction endonuclease subunit S [Syntrophomonas wolfei]
MNTPDGWNHITLRQLLFRVTVKNRPELPLLSVVRDNGVIPRDYDKTENHNAIPKDLSDYLVIEPGQFVINKMKAWQGSCAVSSYYGVVSPAYYVFNLRFENKDFFHWAIRSRYYADCFAALSIGIRVGQWDLPISKLRDVIFFSPPANEQEQIVRWLGWQTSRINKFIRAKRREIECLKELKNAVISKAVTQGLNSNIEKEYSGVTWLGNIPKHWEVRYLSQIANEQSIKNRGLGEKNVLSLSYGNIIRKKDINFGLVPRDYDKYQIVNEGNIILRLTDLQNDHKSLRTGLVHELGIITSAYVCLNTTENPEYIQTILHHYDLKKFFYGLGGGVRQSIGFQDIRYMKIPIPPKNEQEAIAAYLDDKCAAIDRLISKLTDEINLVLEYRTRIISDAVTGKIDLREAVVPDYEEEDELMSTYEEGDEIEEGDIDADD